MEHGGEDLIIQGFNYGSDEDLQCTETLFRILTPFFFSQSMSIILQFSIISSPPRFMSI